MPIEILMPALSPTMEEGNLSKWLVKEGDAIAPGDVIAEIETDKATMEVEAVDEGTMGKILVAEGTEAVPINTLIAVMLEDGEDASALDNMAAAAPPAPKAEAAPAAPSTPAAAPPPALVPAPAMQADKPPKASGRVKASPLAKRLAAQAGIDLATVSGSGPGGRIVKADLDKAPAQAVTSAPAPKAAPVPGADYDEVPLNNIRKTVAERLTVAKRDVPHFYLMIDCEIDKLLAARKTLNAQSPDGEGAYKISVNDFVMRATALALMDVPDANASWGGDKIIRHHHADIAMAVAIPDGLITPIIWQTETKGLKVIAAEAKDLAARARNRKLMPHEYQGGSFSISNLGMFGIPRFTAVINPPHAGILAIGSGEPRPIVKDGAIAIATMMSVTMSCDHRVIDGALGATFLAAFKRYIEDPMMMLL